jgi:hypothetical protein
VTDEDDFDGIERFLPELLPEGSIPVAAVIVAEYLDAEGETQHAIETIGEVRTIHAVGLLSIGTLMLWDEMSDDQETA